MAFGNTNYVHFYIFIFLILGINFSSKYVECLNQSRFILPVRFDNKLADDEFNSLIPIYHPVELSLGTPDMMPPSFLTNALANITRSSNPSVHQYLPPQGSLELRTEIAGLYSAVINRTLDPSKDVAVTLGATQALYLILLVNTLPGEEWIVLEPAFERYYSAIKMTGGTVRSVLLKSNETRGKLNSGDLVLDKDELRRAFNPRTKGIIVNNPNNPTGKLFTKEELLFVAKLAIKWNALIISDEVYEWTIFDSNKLVRMASLGDEIFSRTITISSLSKTYFATGWRLGWAYGPSKLIGNLIMQQPYLSISLTTYAQLAAAEGLKKMRNELGHPNSYFNQLAHSLESKRNFTLEFLNRIGMQTIVPQAGYYVYANWSRLGSRSSGLQREEGSSRDIRFIKWLIKNAGITAAPGSAFYDRAYKNTGENFVRVCFAKKFETLQKAANSLLRRFIE